MKHKKALFISVGVLLFLLLILLAVYFLGGWHVNVSLAGDSDMTIEYGTTFDDPGAKATLSGNFVKGISLPVSVDLTSLKNLGDQTLLYQASFLGFHSSARRQVNVVDTTPPEIRLEHIDGHYTRPIDAYEEEGFSATDNYDGDVTEQVAREEKDGVVYYTVTDSSGNTGTCQREIFYDDPVAPEITLEGEGPLLVEKGEPIQDPGYKAVDDCDGDITDRVEMEDTDDTRTYHVSDSYGNTATATRALQVQDTKPPVLTLNGDAEIYMKAGQSFSDPGCTASDVGDGDLSENIALEGSVNCYRSGDYTLTYSATDGAGNIGTAQRTIHVEPRPQPDVVNPEGKVVYLTFDDGPGEYTQKLLDILEKYNVKVTFFVTGAKADYQYLIGAAYAAGHSIGIHTYSHKYDVIYASEEAYFEDFSKMQEVIKAQTGQETSLMRFPGGSSNTVSSFTPGIMTALTKDVTDMGYQYFDWNVLSGDAGETESTDQVIKNVIDGISGRNTSIVLLHDIKGFSVDAVESILAWGIENGYTFLPLTSTSPTAHHGVNN